MQGWDFGSHMWSQIRLCLTFTFLSLKSHLAKHNITDSHLRCYGSLVHVQGWWHYAVALEPSVTLQRNFYSLSNSRTLIGNVLSLVGKMSKDQADSRRQIDGGSDHTTATNATIGM